MRAEVRRASLDPKVVGPPQTEHLRVPSADLACFNLYLERRDRLEPYLGPLQTPAGDRPLVLGELGLARARHCGWAPGRPTDARLGDDESEHVPGCNLADV